MSSLPRQSIGETPEFQPDAYLAANPLVLTSSLKRKERSQAILVSLVLFALAVSLRVFGVQSFAQQADERHWVSRSAKVVLRFERKDYGSVTTHLGHPGLPPALAMAVAQQVSRPWNRIVGSRIPSLSIDRVAASRLAALLLSSLAIPIVFFCGRRYLGGPAALLAAIALAFDPQHVSTARLAHIDGTLVTLVTGCFFAFLSSEESPRPWKTVVGGALFGLAIATKPTAIALLPAFFLIRVARMAIFRHQTSLLAARDLVGILVAHVILLLLWTKLWDKNHNFISLHRVKLRAARWVHDAGAFLGDHDLLFLGAFTVSLVPLALFVSRRRGERPHSFDRLACLAAIPIVFLLLRFDSLPLENILRFWGWVFKLSSAKHHAYGHAVEPVVGYIQIWWRKASPFLWVGALCLPLALRDDLASRNPRWFTVGALAAVIIWTAMLSTSSKQAFRYLLPVYPLALSVAGWSILQATLRLRSGARRGLLVGLFVPLLVWQGLSLPDAALSVNPLSGSFAAAVDRGLTPVPAGYDRALRMANAHASEHGDILEVLGDLELVQSEYARMFAPEERRLRISPFRGGLGAEWLLEFGGWSDAEHNDADFRSFSDRPFERVYDSVVLSTLHRLRPQRVGETRRLEIGRARSRVGKMRRNDSGVRVLRIRPPEKRDYAFFDLPVRVEAGETIFVFSLRLGNVPVGRLPEEMALRLEANDGCAREVLVRDLLPVTAAPFEHELHCSFSQPTLVRLSGWWENTVPLEIGDVRVERR